MKKSLSLAGKILIFNLLLPVLLYVAILAVWFSIEMLYLLSRKSRGLIADGENIKNISPRLADGLKEISSGSGDIVSATQNLFELPSALLEVVDQVNDKFGRFKTS